MASFLLILQINIRMYTEHTNKKPQTNNEKQSMVATLSINEHFLDDCSKSFIWLFKLYNHGKN